MDGLILNLPSTEGLPLLLIAKARHLPSLAILHCMVDLGDGLIDRILSTSLGFSVKLQLSLVDQFVVTSRDYLNSLSISPSLKTKATVITPPIKKLPVSHMFLKQLMSQKASQVYIGFVGRLAREKGIEYLIQAVKKVKPSPTLVFAGPDPSLVVGETSYAQKIKQQLIENRIPHHFMGFLDEGELAAFYRSLDCLVFPSTNSTEAFGMVQAEAMLLGTPVVASNLPGVRVPVKLTSMGLLALPKNPTSLSLALNQVLSNRSTYSNAYLIAHASEVFNYKNSLNMFNKLVDQTFHAQL